MGLKLGKYQHYKGNYYQVIGECKHSETLEQLVIYKHSISEEIWVRPRSMFFENVIIDSKEFPRFKFVEEKDRNKEFKKERINLLLNLIEIYAEDSPAFNTKIRESKEERELETARRLFSQLPEDLKEEFMNLFNEFEKLETKEAKIAKACDELQALLQNILSEGKAWKDNQLDNN